MLTPEIAYEIGTCKKEKTIEDVSMRNCPTYLASAIKTLVYFGETQFQYIKDIQIEASTIGFTKLRESPHVSKYIEIMNKVEYGDNPEVYITNEQRTKKDYFEFSGSIIHKPLHFRISTNISTSIFALAEKIDIDVNNLDMIAYVIGYQILFSELDTELLNRQNKELLNLLTNESKRIDKYLEIRTLHKIIEYCPITIDYQECNLKWSV